MDSCQIEWYRDNKKVYYRLKLEIVWGGFFINKARIPATLVMRNLIDIQKKVWIAIWQVDRRIVNRIKIIKKKES